MRRSGCSMLCLQGGVGARAQARGLGAQQTLACCVAGLGVVGVYDGHWRADAATRLLHCCCQRKFEYAGVGQEGVGA